MKHNGIKNPNRPDANKFTVYRRGGGLKLFFNFFYSNLLYLYYLSIFIVIRFIHEPMARMIGATSSHVLTLINLFIYSLNSGLSRTNPASGLSGRDLNSWPPTCKSSAQNARSRCLHKSLFTFHPVLIQWNLP